MTERHLARLLAVTVKEHGHRMATRVQRGNDWATMRYARFVATVDALAKALIDRGVQPGERVAIFSPNRPEWSVADYAILSVRGIVVPLYATSTAGQAKHVVGHSGATVALVAGQRELDILAEVWPDLPDLRLIIAFDRVASTDERVAQYDDVVGRPPSAEATAALAQRLAEATPDEIASIVYTSGTTGDPKGVMLTHGGFVDQITALDDFFTITPADHSLSFLPLAHSLERAWTFCVLSHGCMNTYCPDPKDIGRLLPLVKPTLLVSVPRLYEKVYVTVKQAAAESKVKAKLLAWAVRTGRTVARRREAGRSVAGLLKARYRLADRLVLRRIREAIGGEKTVLASGGAPLRQTIEEFFAAAGVLVSQGYGLTEASPLVSFNSPAGFKFGTCGRVLPGGEVSVGEESEIRYRGPNVMAGYWRDEEATAEVITADGWLRTGDIGHVDDDGFLVITDRLKELIVTSGGKNVAPNSIEGMLQADPLFEQAVVLGDNRPFLTLLVKPSAEDLRHLVASLQLPWTSLEEAINRPEIVKAFRERVARVSERLPHHEQIQDLRLVRDDFSIENGLLTPTLKVRRREVERRFGDLINDMYARMGHKRED